MFGCDLLRAGKLPPHSKALPHSSVRLRSEAKHDQDCGRAVNRSSREKCGIEVPFQSSKGAMSWKVFLQRLAPGGEKGFRSSFMWRRSPFPPIRPTERRARMSSDVVGRSLSKSGIWSSDFFKFFLQTVTNEVSPDLFLIDAGKAQQELNVGQFPESS